MGRQGRRIERLRKERVGFHEDQVARLNVPAVLDAVEELTFLAGGARLHDEFAQAGTRRVDRVENPVASGKRVWMRQAIAFGWRNHPFRCSAAGRDLEDAAGLSTSHQNPIVRPPAGADVVGHIAERDRRTAAHRHFLQLPFLVERDPLPIGRKERRSWRVLDKWRLGAGYRRRRRLIHRTQVEPLIRCVRHARTIRRDCNDTAIENREWLILWKVQGESYLRSRWIGRTRQPPH